MNWIQGYSNSADKLIRMVLVILRATYSIEKGKLATWKYTVIQLDGIGQHLSPASLLSYPTYVVYLGLFAVSYRFTNKVES